MRESICPKGGKQEMNEQIEEVKPLSDEGIPEPGEVSTESAALLSRSLVLRVGVGIVLIIAMVFALAWESGPTVYERAAAARAKLEKSYGLNRSMSCWP